MTTLTTPCGCGRPKADGTHDYPRPNTHEFVPYVAPQWIIDLYHAAAIREDLDRNARETALSSAECGCGRPPAHSCHDPWIADAHPFGSIPTN